MDNRCPPGCFVLNRVQEGLEGETMEGLEGLEGEAMGNYHDDWVRREVSRGAYVRANASRPMYAYLKFNMLATV